MRIGIGIGPPLGPAGPLDEVLGRCAKAEADGFATVWAPHVFGFDAVMLLALAGRVTRTVELGTYVVPTYPRHPVALAQQALTAQAATGNRFTLGIGLSHRITVEGSLGLDYSKPLRHLREYLSVLNPLLDGQWVEFRGEEYCVAAQVAVPGARRPPVLVAALGPAMLRLAGTMADGTAIWLGGPKYLEQTAVPLITKAAREAGRPTPRIVAGLPVAVTNEVDSARATVSASFAAHATRPSYRAILDLEGVPGPGDVAIVGSEADVARQIWRLADLGVTDFNAVPVALADDPGTWERTYTLVAGLARAKR